MCAKWSGYPIVPWGQSGKSKFPGSSLFRVVMLLFRDDNTLNKHAPPQIHLLLSHNGDFALLCPRVKSSTSIALICPNHFTDNHIFAVLPLRIERPPPLPKSRYLCVRPLPHRSFGILPKSRAATESHDVAIQEAGAELLAVEGQAQAFRSQGRSRETPEARYEEACCHRTRQGH